MQWRHCTAHHDSDSSSGPISRTSGETEGRKQSGEEVNVATKRIGKPAKKPVSSKVQAVDKQYRGEARADRTRKRQIEYERPGSWRTTGP